MFYTFSMEDHVPEHHLLWGIHQFLERFMRAMTTGKRAAPFIGFPDERALWGTLTPLRWDILKVMTGEGSLALREIARRVGRDVRGVHTDVHALLVVGLIERNEISIGISSKIPLCSVLPRNRCV